MSGFLACKTYENAKKTSLKLPPPQARFPRHGGEHGTSERGVMGTSAERERGVMGRKKRERGKSLGLERTRERWAKPRETFFTLKDPHMN